MSILLALLLVCATVLTGLFYLWQLRRTATELIDLVAFNTAGGGLFARLIPNLAYLALFLILFRLCWF